jgi:hypothetical protein
VGPRAGLDYVEKKKLLTLPGLELRPLGPPARSHSLHRLRYAVTTEIFLPKRWMDKTEYKMGGGSDIHYNYHYTYIMIHDCQMVISLLCRRESVV